MEGLCPTVFGILIWYPPDEAPCTLIRNVTLDCTQAGEYVQCPKIRTLLTRPILTEVCGQPLYKTDQDAAFAKRPLKGEQPRRITTSRRPAFRPKLKLNSQLSQE
jgi:hypothetical protein